MLATGHTPVKKRGSHKEGSAAAAGVLVTYAALLFIWEAAVRFFQVRSFILPPPSAVVISFAKALSDVTILKACLSTLSSAIAGFAIGTAAGILFSLLIFSSPFCKGVLHPLLIGIQTIPKVTLAPLMLVWFGLGVAPKLVLIGIITFFPVLSNVLTGLSSIDRRHLDLFRILGAGKWQTMAKLRMPAALPFLFAALETTSVYSLTGAIIVEFVGSQGGIGSILLLRNYNLDIAGSFAIILILSLAGVGINWSVRWLERRTVFWIGDRDQGSVRELAEKGRAAVPAVSG